MVGIFDKFYKIPAPIKEGLRQYNQRIMAKSLQDAGKYQDIHDLFLRLSQIVPDIRFQYSNFVVDSPYLETKVRYQHAFQISLVQLAINCLGLNKCQEFTVVDIGDSAGSHILYLKELYPQIRALSVNLDAAAVKRIKNKGLEAIHARAEDINDYNIKADIFLSFEMLEHLMDPIHFLKSIADNTECKALVVTIPYVKNSRVGLSHIAYNRLDKINAEGVHIFELSPHDWRLIFQHSGWSIINDEIYLQYPRRGMMRCTKMLWRHLDYEGFYGAILERNDKWSSCYIDW